MICTERTRLFASIILGIAALGEASTELAEAQEFYLMFRKDSVDPNPRAFATLANAVRQVQSSRPCPLGRLTIFTAGGDDLFQPALALARRDVLLRALDGQGLDVAGRVVVDTVVLGKGTDSRVVYRDPSPGVGSEGDVQFEPARDEQPPTLTVQSEPAEGTKVRAGQSIKVLMLARDDATRWETGIKTIQLVAESENGRFVASNNYPPCVQPPEQRVNAVYTVPANPPPIVRLTAIADDHAGRTTVKSGEFPTGDWYGTLRYSLDPRPAAYAVKVWGSMDLALTYDGRGNLTGRIIGTQHQQMEVPAGPLAPRCAVSVTPGQFRANLLGSWTPGRDAMSITLADNAEYKRGEITPCPPAPAEALAQPAPHMVPLFQTILRSLRPQGTDTFVGKISQEDSRPGPTTIVREYSVTLRRARD